MGPDVTAGKDIHLNLKNNEAPSIFIFLLIIFKMMMYDVWACYHVHSAKVDDHSVTLDFGGSFDSYTALVNVSLIARHASEPMI